MSESTDSLVPGGDTGRRGRGLLFGGVWLLFLVTPVTQALYMHPGLLARTLIVAVTVMFCLLYVAVLALGRRTDPPWLRFAILGALSLLAAVYCVLAESGMFTFVYLAAAGTIVLPPRRAVWWVVSLVTLTVALPLAVPGWELDGASTLSVLLSAVAAFGFVQLLRRNWELSQAHDRIAQLAVADERLRFSRDLHDLLGHSLTVITVKAELARRLLERAPERAAAEIDDVERLAREALSDVRATVAGYRATSLAAEISQARQSLAAAGIEAVLPNSVDEVTGPRRELFGWVVREGVTNVVRHSMARTCEVRLTPTTVEIRDDGVGAVPDQTDDAGGHGLSGLRERLRAVGGSLTASTPDGGGFRLLAHVPDGASTSAPAAREATG